LYKLLVVDDSSVIRGKIARCTKGQKFELVGQARDGLEALEIFHDKSPQVVTMDLTMPNMGGTECVAQMIASDPSVRILVISALADVETGIEALELGARGFLCKPFSDQQLNSALLDLVEGVHERAGN
jgi:two-component system chemotaxis response regulator CheY